MAETLDTRAPWRAASRMTAATVLMAAIDLGQRILATNDVFRRPGWWRALRLPAGLALFAALIAPWWIGKLVTQTTGMRDAVVSDNLLYLGHRVLPVQTLGDLDRVMAEHPRGSAVLSQAALSEVADRSQLRVLPLDWLNFEPLVLVSYPDAAAPRVGSRP